MGVGIIRPPLVYGPEVKANFLRLLHWIDKEKILPLGAVENKRSVVSVWNLCDLILRLLATPRAACWCLDGVRRSRRLSTPELIRQIATAMSRPRAVARSARRLAAISRACVRPPPASRPLCGSLVVDISNTRTELGWTPPVSLAEGLGVRPVGICLRVSGARWLRTCLHYCRCCRSLQ